MTRYNDGTIMQAGLSHRPGDFGHRNITHPVLAVVLNVYCSDDPLNASAYVRQNQRGSQCECRVLVINDGTENPWQLPNVVIPPPSSSGYDNYSEELPRSTSGTIDGSYWSPDLINVDPTKLNGDYCIVDFVGGKVRFPFIVSWWPHPSNKSDITTSGQVTKTDDPRKGLLSQRRRSVKRFQGTKLSMSSNGSIYVDTSQANSVKKQDGIGARDKVDPGGDIDVTIKDTRKLEVNFNAPVVTDVENTNPVQKGLQGNLDILQPNPVRGEDEKPRSEDNTKFYMDKDFIRAVAGQVVEMSSSATMHFGTQATADENIVLGQAFKTLLTDILNAILTLTVPTGVGPSGPPINSAVFQAALNTVLADDQLSTWIFAQKDPP